VNSKMKRRGWLGCLAALGFLLTTASGCQTNFGGMTLPSGHYLEHLPQYIPPSPPYPLPNELARQQAIAAQPVAGGAGVGVLPPPLPGGGGGIP
jgi:hypothetical protein